jgi:hypothetical protein
MRFSQADGGLPDLLDRILADAGDRKTCKQVIYVIRRDSLTGNRLNVNNRGTRGDHVVAPAGHDEMTLGVM